MELPALHHTFPLTITVHKRNNLPAPFSYSKIENARQLLHQERVSGAIHPTLPVYASDLAGLGLLGKLYVLVIHTHLSRHAPALLQDFHARVEENVSQERLQAFLRLLLDTYPVPGSAPPSSTLQFLSSSTSGVPNQQLSYLTVLLLYCLRENPAAAPYYTLFLADDIVNHSVFNTLISVLERALSATTSSHGKSQNLLSFLKKPFQLYPGSIADQLSYIRGHWKDYLPEDVYRELSRRIDSIKEEKRERGRLSDHPPVVVPPFPPQSNPDPGERHFSQDEDWMSNAVLIAKNIYVWLDQLSKKYQREIRTLDAIPQSELEEISQRGINCIWLIGIWERSPASREIKKRCGNPDAIPSAYSIYDYGIADDLGGDKALQHLEDCAARAGVRLAADMVPNHMGIFSRWTLEHPERFLQLDHKPFPSYSYTGPDLSPVDHISIYLEDHYYQQTDAAVVFKRVDHRTGKSSYIYHGNDGTAMPWNDTAQLNFLRRDVREAVIDTILKVADHFPVIRFDAAMTLAKKHYQRLWFPPPGEGGAIPTRSEHGLTREEFEQAFPVEFWRQVVDRISEERPNTLLIAEAFWMMEGYFVRTLGMHRVYNSAFMHMLRDENNAKFRDLIIKTLNFDPGILKRYVNFMNNPDEETAVAQFGKGGKYFGVCTMMCTLPGTPMFGHGQIEGYHEKYGMEYDRAYYDERPDPYLLEEHRQKIFPLLKKRHIFSHADHFVLFDFTTDQGFVDDDVFVYANRHDEQSALVIYHNKWGDTQGTVLQSSIDPHRRLGPALGLEASDTCQGKFITFSDLASGDKFLIPSNQFFEEGLKLSLGAYESHVFHHFQQVKDSEHGEYQTLYSEIGTSGISNLENRLCKIRYRNVSSVWIETIRALKSLDKSAPGVDLPLPIMDISRDSTLFSTISRLYSEVLRKNKSEPDLPTNFIEQTTRVCLAYLSCFSSRELEIILSLPDTRASPVVNYALVMWAI